METTHTKRHLRNQIRLELVQVDVERPIETERDGDRRDNLSDQPVQVGEAGLGHVKPLFADIVDRFIIDLKR